MAKPNEVITWATDATFSSGGAAGRDTQTDPAGWPDVPQGFVPGTKIKSPFVNRILGHVAEWFAWVNAGSSAGAADAHIVETDANGDTEVQDLTAVEITGTGNATLASLDVNGASYVAGQFTTEGKILLLNDGAGIRYRVDRTTLTDADVTLDVTADVYIATTAPTDERVVTLKSTSPAPLEGEVIKVSCPQVGSIGSDEKRIFQREDATELARIVSTSPITLAGTVAFIFTNNKWVVLEAGPTTTIATHGS